MLESNLLEKNVCIVVLYCQEGYGSQTECSVSLDFLNQIGKKIVIYAIADHQAENVYHDMEKYI